MTKNPTYTSVVEMVRRTTDTGSFAEAFEKRLISRKIVKELMVLRATHGLSQKDIAERLGCTQSRISKLELTSDTDLRIGDLAEYANAVGLRMSIILEPKGPTPVARVRRLAFRIKQELDHLAGLATIDQGIARGVAAFFGEAFFNMLKMLQESAKRLPVQADDGKPFVSLEICDDDDERSGGEDAENPETPSREDRTDARRPAVPQTRIGTPTRN